MAVFDIAGASELLKTLQEVGTIEEIFNSDDMFVGRIQKDDDPEGLKWKSLIRTGRTGGFGWLNPDSTLPTAVKANYVNPELVWKDFVGKITVYESMIARAQTDRGSYARPILRAVKDMITDSSDDLCRVLLGDGSGTIGFTVAGASGTTVATEKVQLRNPTVTGNPIQPADALKWSVGMTVEAWTLNTPSGTQLTADGTITSLVVSAVDVVNGIITFSTNLTATGATNEIVDSNTYFTKLSARTATLGREPMGIYGILSASDPPMNQTGSTDQGGVLGLNSLPVATNPTWVATVLSNSNVLRPITTRLCTQALDSAHVNGGGKPSLIVMPMNLRTEFIESQLAIRRNVNQSIMAGENTAGFTENRDAGRLWECNGIPIWPDKYAYTYNAAFLDMSKIYLKRVHPFEWVNRDGGMWRATSSGLGWDATLYGVMNLCTTNRAAHALVTDLQQTP